MQKIVDSHVHFWDDNKARIDWVSDLPILNKAFHPANLFEEAGDEILIEKLVFVQADVRPEDSLKEVQWVTQLAVENPQIQGIVAYAPLENPQAAKQTLDALRDYPLVKGVRRLLQSEEAGFAKQASFIQGVELLSDYSYSFDICIYHHQLPDVLYLVQQCPQINFVLDHIGKPGIKQGLIEPWKAHITELSQYRNVWCKLSGIVTEANRQDWRLDDLEPYISHIIDAFGADRLMYGGDWPVLRLASSYGHWLQTLQSLVSDLDQKDQHQIFYDNAVMFYSM